MESLKDKIKQRFREEHIRSGNLNARLYKDIEKDVKEAVLKDIENMKKLEHTVIMAVRFPQDKNINDIHKIIEELSRYKNSKFKVFGDFKDDL